MTTPAHTHSDIHGIYIDDDEFEENYEPGIDPYTGRPRYEKYNEGSAVWVYWRDYIGARNFMDFAEFFTKINNHTDYFPSDDYEGDSNNFTNPWNIPQLKRNDIIYYDILGIDHYKLPGMRNLADWISPLNVMSVAATYNIKHPGTRTSVSVSFKSMTISSSYSDELVKSPKMPESSY